MVVHHVVQLTWQLLRWVRHPLARALPARPEFPRVNAVAGSVPVAPELSGLQVRRARVPRHASKLLIQLAYRWQPSRSHLERRDEAGQLNRSLRGRGNPKLPPPILSYTEGTELAPTRLQPLPSAERLALDLNEVARAEFGHCAPVVTPRLHEPDQSYLTNYRPLLPRRYRHFLRTSPYPRLAAALLLALWAAGGSLWVLQLQHERALAAGRASFVRHAFQFDLRTTLLYGVAPAQLRSVRRHLHVVEAAAPPSFLLGGGAQRFYAWQEQAYRSLRRELARLRRRTLHYWVGQEQIEYAALARARQALQAWGVPQALPDVPACATPACYRTAVAAQRQEVANWQGEVAGLKREATSLGAAADPVGLAAGLVEEVHSLAGLAPAAIPPILPANLDARQAAGSDPARTGALAHLDVTALRAALLRRFSGRVIFVSTEEGTVSCYQRGVLVTAAPAVAGPLVPTGVFQLGARLASVPTTLWLGNGAAAQVRYGAIPDWMAFDGHAALQGAPWRTSFGLAALSPAGYAPQTPAAVDLPPTAAQRVFAWSRLGMEVVVF